MAVLKSDRTTMEIKYTKIDIIPGEFEPKLYTYFSTGQTITKFVR